MASVTSFEPYGILRVTSSQAHVQETGSILEKMLRPRFLRKRTISTMFYVISVERAIAIVIAEEDVGKV